MIASVAETKAEEYDRELPPAKDTVIFDLDFDRGERVPVALAEELGPLVKEVPLSAQVGLSL